MRVLTLKADTDFLFSLLTFRKLVVSISVRWRKQILAIFIKLSNNY